MTTTLRALTPDALDRLITDPIYGRDDFRTYDEAGNGRRLATLVLAIRAGEREQHVGAAGSLDNLRARAEALASAMLTAIEKAERERQAERERAAAYAAQRRDAYDTVLAADEPVDPNAGLTCDGPPRGYRGCYSRATRCGLKAKVTRNYSERVYEGTFVGGMPIDRREPPAGVSAAHHAERFDRLEAEGKIDRRYREDVRTVNLCGHHRIAQHRFGLPGKP